MNPAKFDSLPSGVQQVVSIAARHGAMADRVAEAFKSRIVDYEVVASRMEVYTPTAEEKAKFEAVAKPPVIEWMRERIGDEKVDRFLDAVHEAEAALGYRRK